MAGRRKAPACVLVVDRAYGLTGIRKAGKRLTMPGGVVLVDATVGVTDPDLVPNEIHTYMQPGWGKMQLELMELALDDLYERAGWIDHAHLPLKVHEKTRPEDDLWQTCRCGARRTRPRGPHEWSEWT